MRTTPTSARFADCHWPALPPRYAAGLRDAVSFILERFDVTGIIATGSIIRGVPDVTSDLDLWVIQQQPVRQRIQRLSAGVPTEIFVNPPSRIRRYFADEHRDARPVTAHMLASGVVILARKPIVEELRAEAKDWLERRSNVSATQVTVERYRAATKFEDGMDVLDRDPATAMMLLTEAVTLMLHLHCRLTLGTLPRAKELLTRVGAQGAELGVMAHGFFTESNIQRRVELAGLIADRTIGARGFFEWESEAESTE